MKHPYLFHDKLTQRNESGTSHHGLLSTSFDTLKFILGVRLHGGSLPKFNFFNVNSQILQRNRKVLLTNCLETNFHDISISSLRVREYEL